MTHHPHYADLCGLINRAVYIPDSALACSNMRFTGPKGIRARQIFNSNVEDLKNYTSTAEYYSCYDRLENAVIKLYVDACYDLITNTNTFALSILCVPMKEYKDAGIYSHLRVWIRFIMRMKQYADLKDRNYEHMFKPEYDKLLTKLLSSFPYILEHIPERIFIVK